MLTNRDIFKRQIVFHRKKMNLKQSELAELVPISAPALGAWERGEAEPSLEKLANLSEVFNCSVDSLIKGPDYIAQEYLPPWLKEIIPELVQLEPYQQHSLKALLNGYKSLKREKFVGPKEFF
jgi:transcriptional regulator with XRE-family HTH domain